MNLILATHRWPLAHKYGTTCTGNFVFIGRSQSMYSDTLQATQWLIRTNEINRSGKCSTLFADTTDPNKDVEHHSFLLRVFGTDFDSAQAFFQDIQALQYYKPTNRLHLSFKFALETSNIIIGTIVWQGQRGSKVCHLESPIVDNFQKSLFEKWMQKKYVMALGNYWSQQTHWSFGI